jgi:hypothetical protein
MQSGLLADRVAGWPGWLGGRLQVSVALTCTMQKDLLHAGYLAIALVFFRQRSSLMTAPLQLPPAAVTTESAAAAASDGQPAGLGRSGLSAGLSSNSSGRRPNRNLFAWLPAFNFLVIAATLAYQVRFAHACIYCICCICCISSF